MDEMIRIATAFSGIGAIEYALKQLKKEHSIVFACDNGERIIDKDREIIEKEIEKMTDIEAQKHIKELYSETGKPNLMKESYFANYNICEDQWHEDIRFLNAKKYQNEIDLFVGGSPCQSFSVNGKRYGLKDIRGTLFYEFARIIEESQPKTFIYENVKGMLTHDNGKTWEIVKSIFEKLNYNIYIQQKEDGKENPILNAKDYGIPQNRERLFIVGFRKDIKIKSFEFPKKKKLTKTVFDFLDENVDSKYYLGQKGFEFVTTHPSRAQVSEPIMRTQKANQQFNWNGDFIFVPLHKVEQNQKIMQRAHVSKWKGQRGVIRQITPRECLRLMGFKDDFKIVMNDTNMYRQSGNSIVVNVLMELVKSIEKTGVWEKHD